MFVCQLMIYDSPGSFHAPLTMSILMKTHKIKYIKKDKSIIMKIENG